MLLHEWQQDIQQHILQPEFPVFDLRLGIYQRAYRLRLAEALRTNFPALYKALGDADFDQMASCYLDAHPSRHPSIRWFGDKLPEWLSLTTPYKDNALFAELAHFEWKIRHSIDAADAIRITANELNNINPASWSGLTFALHPSVTLSRYSLNIPPLCEAILQDDDTITPSNQPMHWLVYRRPDQLSNWRSLPEQEYHALQLVKQGLPFGELCEWFVMQHHGNENTALTQIATWLRHWVEEGILSRR